MFLPLEKYFSDRVGQTYISVIQAASLDGLLKALNRLALEMGLEDLQKLRIDTTVGETAMHYPTNNALLGDCIRTSTRIVSPFTDKCVVDLVRDDTGQAKTSSFRINVTNDQATRRELCVCQFRLFDRRLRQTKRVLEHLHPWYEHLDLADQPRVDELAAFVPKMETIRDVAYRREMHGEQVPPEDTLFSIDEDQTEMSVTGQGHGRLGRTASLARGRSGVMLQAAV